MTVASLWDPEVGAEAVRLVTLRRAWAEFLGRLNWSHFATLTSRFEATPDHLLRECPVYVRRLERMTQGPAYWFAAVEGGAAGRSHLHVLLGATERLRRAQLEKHWRLGVTDFARFDVAHHPRYVVKQLGAGIDAGERYAMKFPRLSSGWKHDAERLISETLHS